ncbi:MAG TPA: SDR family oxidoreductase [Bryobacteraceae bacterium]|jgi:NADP-dependent 3-hydroxy acid dehydrogenase YdfG
MLTNRKVLITGASSGIGRATAVAFARAGAQVMVSARREDRLKELQAELAKEGYQIALHAADAGERKQMEELHAAAVKALGTVDTLVYAAGTNTPHRSMKGLAPEIWDEMIAVNLSGAYHLSRLLLPAMREARFGDMIYISSISGVYPDVSGPAYQASKRGMFGIANSVRVEEKENGVRTCVICPGLVDTEILNKRLVKPGPEILSKALQAEDVAAAALFVAGLPPRASIPEMLIMPCV